MQQPVQVLSLEPDAYTGAHVDALGRRVALRAPLQSMRGILIIQADGDIQLRADGEG
jgi:hypothetical protein